MTNLMTNHVMAIDIGGSKMMVGLISDQGKVIDKKIQPLEAGINVATIIAYIFEYLDLFLHNYGEFPITAIGVSIPGLADSRKGIWVYSPFSQIKSLEIRDILVQRYGLPVFVMNDVNACAYGEKAFGAGQSSTDFLWVTVSNGVGGGLILNGEIYEGIYFNAGEIGHFIVEENGPECPCGNKGCLEACASGVAIAKRYSARCGSGSDPHLTAQTIAKRALRGEPLAVQIFKETGYYLGKAISYAVNLVNPQKVILGGGVSLSSELFMPELQRVLSQMIFKAANQKLIVEKTALSYDAALIGAAAIALHQIGGN